MRSSAWRFAKSDPELFLAMDTRPGLLLHEVTKEDTWAIMDRDEEEFRLCDACGRCNAPARMALKFFGQAYDP